MSSTPDADRLAWLADRLEINDLLVCYGTALDTRDFDLFDDVFTEDADLDYEVVGGFRGSPAEFKAWIADASGFFTTWLHHVTNSTVTIDGETATAVTYLINPVVLAHDGQTLMEGGRYHDSAGPHRRRLAHQRPP